MIVTEEEAKTKRCQESFGDGFVAQGQTSSSLAMYGSGSAFAITSSPAFCLGRGCMAWRWFDNIDDKAITEPRGYCGKAGKP